MEAAVTELLRMSGGLHMRLRATSPDLCPRPFSVEVTDVRRVNRMQPKAQNSYEIFDVPESRDAMVQQAGSALAQRLKRRKLGKKKKGFKDSAGSGIKLAIELALADESPESVMQVADQILRQLDGDLQKQCVLAFHDIQAALLASDRLDNDVCSLQDFEPPSVAGTLLVVGAPPMSPQEEGAVKVMKTWRGPAAVSLSFGTNSFADHRGASRSSLETIFAYEPVAAKGLIRTTEALIFRSMVEDKPSPWLLYKRSWGKYKLIGKTSQRPSASDLELALYNASASESPITKGIKAFKAATSKPKK